jgi:hypothetical protein
VSCDDSVRRVHLVMFIDDRSYGRGPVLRQAFDSTARRRRAVVLDRVRNDRDGAVFDNLHRIMDGRRRVIILDVRVDLKRRVVAARTDAEHNDPVICSDATGAVGCRGPGSSGASLGSVARSLDAGYVVAACPCSSWSSRSPCSASHMGSSGTPSSPCGSLGGGGGSSAIGAKKRRTPEPAIRGLRWAGGIADGASGLALRALELATLSLALCPYLLSLVSENKAIVHCAAKRGVTGSHAACRAWL